VGDLRQGLAHLRHAFDLHRAVFNSRSSADASSISAAAMIALSRHRDGGQMHRIAGGHRLAAGESAEAQRRAGGIARDHVDVLGLDAEHVADKLRQHGLDALALRARPVVMTILPDAPTRRLALSNGPRPVPST
jgi:hypothetical protein